MNILPGTMNSVRGAGTSQVTDLGRPPALRRDTFEDILTDAEVPTTPQRQVCFADVAASTPLPRPAEHLEQRTQHSGSSQVSSLS